MIYSYILKPLFFRWDAEKAHYRMMSLFGLIRYIPFGKAIIRSLFAFNNEKLEKEVCGLKFKNPVGLAAGFDKDGRFIDLLALLGFGFIEVGTVTPLPQEGNPKPRLFRLPKDEALINRMGFNNMGVDYLVEQLKKVKTKDVIIGGNIGKNKVTPNDRAYEDYEICFKKLFDYVHYFVVNVSSPNTPGLRELQDKNPLMDILTRLVKINQQKPIQKPIFLKIAPDLTDGQLNDIVEICKESGIDGLIVTNTTINRENLQTDSKVLEQIGNGGLSGQPLFEYSTDIVQFFRSKLGPDFPLIGVGGIQKPHQAQQKIDSGADLIQVYSGFVYEGPAMVRNINKYLANKMG